MRKIILSAIVLSTVLFSCKKDDAKVCDLNSANVAGAYKITAIKYKPSATLPEVDVFATLDACEKDDITVLNANGTMAYQDAGTVCAPAGDYTSTWSLTGSILTVDGDPYTVSSFTCSGATLTQTGTTAGELTTVTLVKQ